MSHSSWKSGLMLTVAGLVVGCASSSKNQKPLQDAAMGSVDIHQPRSGNEQVSQFDLNHDQRPDAWSYTVEAVGEDGKPYRRLVRKELDINWDGKIDIVRHYDAKESMESESMDLDFDGRIDQTNFYEKSVVIRKERDLDYDGRVDLWIHFEKGKVSRKERDANGDGKVDYWEYWEGEVVDRVGEDVDGDGTVDRWTKNPDAQS